MSLAISFLKAILILVLVIGTAAIGLMIIPSLLDPEHKVYAQNATPPPVTTPTPTIVPTPTTPNPNLQYLPQKSYVQTFAPENGIPSSIPLQALPPVVAPAPVQQTAVGGIGINDIIQYAIAGGTGLMAKFGWDKAKKAQTTGQENSAMNVKQAIVQDESLKLQYENMGTEKANAITDKPEIRLTKIAEMKDTAVETATKA